MHQAIDRRRFVHAVLMPATVTNSEPALSQHALNVSCLCIGGPHEFDIVQNKTINYRTPCRRLELPNSLSEI